MWADGKHQRAQSEVGEEETERQRQRETRERERMSKKLWNYAIYAFFKVHGHYPLGFPYVL